MGADDLAHWQTRLVTANTAAAAELLRRRRYTFVSPRLVALGEDALGFRKGLLVRDADGHALRLTE